MTDSVCVASVTLSAPGEHLSVGQLQRRARSIEKRLRLLIPKPRRFDLELESGIVAHKDQFVAEVRIKVLPQQLLPMDDESSEPVAVAIAREIDTLRERIEADIEALYARAGGSTEPLTNRQASLSDNLGGEAVHLEFANGPIDQRIPDEPSPIDETARMFSAQVNVHYFDSVAISQVREETGHGAIPVLTESGRLSLVMLSDEGEATDALHWAIAEIFISDRYRRLYFMGRAQTVPGTRKIRRIIFERVVERT